MSRFPVTLRSRAFFQLIQVYFSTILATTFSPLGNSGNITITSENLRVLDGGAIGSATFSGGQASAIQINTTGLTEIAGVNPFAAPLKWLWLQVA
jgi:large exoprotein involved in heme utilization and adhesion